MSTYKTVNAQDRIILKRRWETGDAVVDIAHELGLSVPTLYVELRRGRTGKILDIGRAEYSPELAAKNYYQSSANKGKRKQTGKGAEQK